MYGCNDIYGAPSSKGFGTPGVHCPLPASYGSLLDEEEYGKLFEGLRIKTKVKRINRIIGKINGLVDSGRVDKARKKAKKVAKIFGRLEKFDWEDNVGLDEAEELEEKMEALNAFAEGEIDDPRDYEVEEEIDVTAVAPGVPGAPGAPGVYPTYAPTYRPALTPTRRRPPRRPRPPLPTGRGRGMRRGGGFRPFRRGGGGPRRGGFSGLTFDSYDLATTGLGGELDMEHGLLRSDIIDEPYADVYELLASEDVFGAIDDELSLLEEEEYGALNILRRKDVAGGGWDRPRFSLRDIGSKIKRLQRQAARQRSRGDTAGLAKTMVHLSDAIAEREATEALVSPELAGYEEEVAWEFDDSVSPEAPGGSGVSYYPG